MYVLAFDLRDLAPWQWSGITSALLTGFLWATSEKAHRYDTLTRSLPDGTLSVMRVATKLRTIATVITLVLSVGFAVLALKGVDLAQLPPGLHFLRVIYGPWLSAPVPA